MEKNIGKVKEILRRTLESILEEMDKAGEDKEKLKRVVKRAKSISRLFDELEGRL